MTASTFRRLTLRCAIALVLVLIAVLPLEAQTEKKAAAPKGDPAVLTLDRIFSSNEFDEAKAPALKWRKNGARYVTRENANGGQQLIEHDPATGKQEILVPDHWLIPPGETKAIAIDSFEFSSDESRLLIYTNSKRVWRVNSRGDYWVLDLSTRELKKLGGPAPASSMMFATFAPDGKRIAYVHQNDLYVQDLLDGRIARLTHDGSDTIINGTFDWVYEEELGLRNGFRWSPDSKSIAYWQLNSNGVKEFFITKSGAGPYPRVMSIRYPKTGEVNSAARIGVVHVSGGPAEFVRPGVLKTSSLPGGSGGGATTAWFDVPGDPREHYIAKMEWSGADIALQQFNRLQNVNRVMLANPKTGLVRTVLTEKDDAWVENENEFRWVDNGRSFVWLSERDGWQHAYLVSRNGESIAPITKGAFDVIQIEAIDEKGGWLYYLASPANPTQRYLYRVPLKGGAAERLTADDQPGMHSYAISPNAQWAVHTYTRFATPAVATLVQLPDHKVVRTFADNAPLKKRLAALRLGPSDLFRVETGKETVLDGWCIKPPDFDAAKKYPVLFYVYGEPAGQTVLDRWDGKRFFWHSLLAQQGYVVMSVDNRGTPAPRGREWRRCVYRQIGVLASADQANAVRALLKERPYMDASRLAIWGWSGGGSMTLNAIFRYPELYKTAMAVAPVPNQRHYDTIYQERYMGLPSDNAEGYRKGSPIHFAKNLKGNLLIVHGTGDDNCHYLGLEALIDELIVHNKPFTMMAYPNRSHSISEGRNTTRHLYETLTRYLHASN